VSTSLNPRPRRSLAAALLLGLIAPVLSAGPAAAAMVGGYGDPRPASFVQHVFVFVGAPLGAMLVLAALTLRTGRGVGSVAYRPGRPWGYDREWFGTEPPETSESPRMSVPGLGGASARW